ncbi:exo-beta-N-acetylmuramidase NamZ family protein [Gaoshiqia sp. Z1-71]|uniref:exo-beta-N-acetylmuramidase NamZ family protein n=1 Tax=Gaoshiqia hydrogeniformans TaxID=3290090 RepID=UPI003BF8F1BF
MKSLFWILGLFLILILLPNCVSEKITDTSGEVISGAARTDIYLPLLNDKRVGLVVNQTSVVDSVHLVDFLLSKKVNITAIYAPEHGYKGTVERGEYIESSIDSVTGIPVFSIYGRTRKPAPEMLRGIDVMLFDIQDIGVRFFTVVSTMSNVMEACAENGIQVIILDRPNPLGYYVDGPVMKPEFTNFIGLHQVPVVHGLTLGEFAMMINGESWLKDSVKCDLEVIPVKNYTHATRYQLPVVPSPNLPDMKSVYLYPMVCFFEGAEVNEGRGTFKPFQQFGAPWFTPRDHAYVPVSIPVLAFHPKFENDTCYGYDLSDSSLEELQDIRQIQLKYLIEFYQKCPDKEAYFTSFFENLAGSDTLRKQIIAGHTEEQIRESWNDDLQNYKEMRKKYLLYDETAGTEQ